MFAVTPVNFLDNALAPVPARQIKINVRPAFTAFVQKTFEDEMVTHRINRRDPETKTDRAVGRAAAALHHHVVFAAKIHDVPYDQKISGKPKPGNEREFFFQLTFYFFCNRLVTLLRTKQHYRAQERIHGVSVRHRIFRKFVTDVFE